MPDAIGSLRALEAAARGESPPDPGFVAREFEALLLGEMMKSATKPLAEPDPLSGGSAGRLYQEMFLEEVARQVAARGGLGLAAALGERLQSPAQPAEPPPGGRR